MATVYSDIRTAQRSDRQSDQLQDGQQELGVIHFANAKMTFASAPSNGDIVELLELPKGATVIPRLCTLASSAALCDDIDVGTPDNPNQFADAMDMGTAAKNLAFSGGDDANVLPAAFTAATVVQATLTSGGTGIAIGEVLEAQIAYRLKD